MRKLLLVLFLLIMFTVLFIGCVPGMPPGPCVGSGVINGGFETGDFSGWTVTVSDQFPKIQNININSGAYAGYIGDGAWGLEGTGPDDTASIEQNVDIPSCAVNPVLSIYYDVNGSDGDYCDEYDNMKFYINDTQIFCVWDVTGEWQLFQYNLDAYIGTTINLKISSWTDDAYVSVNYYVDDISITWE